MILHMDFETFSSVPIAKAGMFKYMASNDFEILLCAYSIDDAPVNIIDLTTPDGKAMFDTDMRNLIFRPDTVILAYNAAFEAGCIARYFNVEITKEFASKFRCVMLHGLYCGFTAGLDATGKALGLAPDKQKLSAGKSLIRYFCIPCTPTITNGQRRRNFPKHDHAKWELFKTYCKGDVITEMEIDRRLSAFPVPDEIEKQWQTDVIINARGVAVDMDLVQGALQIGNSTREKLMQEAIRITGLENPNSIAQLSRWLEAETNETVTDLRKETVAALLEGQVVTGNAERMLEIRQELGKTSTKKYDAIEACVGTDGRVRGLLQFYGANRTGRWAGRLVQIQNLPRTYLEQLDVARAAVKKQQAETLRFCFGSVNDTLSQLIRTSFVAAPGNKLVDADFSSIEARIISWLAQESWRIEVFKTHGKIYEASASQMFGVPIEKIKKGNPEYALRQRGKVAELALGYQGSTGALITMGALKMGIPEEDLPDIVSRWRDANQRIVELWYKVESAAVSTIQTGRQEEVNNLIFSREFDLANDLDFLTITLPSSRKLYYAHPELGVNQWDRPSINYLGVNQTTKQWTRLETYGGKIVENVVQAIARDCLAVAIERLETAGFPVVFHVHDEVVIDCPESQANLDKVVELMTKPIPWALGLPLNADGWIGDFFKKD